MDNEEIFDTTGYTVYGLDNETSYTFGVKSVYEGADGELNYESNMITVDAQPIYVYGDVTGTISDPNGATIDSVIVSSILRKKISSFFSSTCKFLFQKLAIFITRVF